MAQQTFTGRKRVRKFFGHIKEVAEMPNLIEVQKASYDQFLMVKDPPGGRSDEGLQAVVHDRRPEGERAVLPPAEWNDAVVRVLAAVTLDERPELPPPGAPVDLVLLELLLPADVADTLLVEHDRLVRFRDHAA